MEKSIKDQTRVIDKTHLLLKFNYASSVLSLLFGLVCMYLLHIRQVIPYVLFAYFVLNLINVLAFKKHGNLTTMALTTSILSLFGTVAITLYSGGISSPFVFVLALIVLAGYVSTRVFGKIYLYTILILITLLYFLGIGANGPITNVVPNTSKDIFSFISILFSVYLLGGIFGKHLLRAHHSLYKAKREVEAKIHEKKPCSKKCTTG